MADESIPGVKMIRFNTAQINLPDDPTYPFKLEAALQPPDFMTAAVIAKMGGCEEVVVRSTTKEAMDKFIQVSGLRQHRRLSRLTITGPDGILEQIPKGS